MTKAERARLIDQQEFEAECRAIRAKVSAEMQRRHNQRKAIIAAIEIKTKPSALEQHRHRARKAAEAKEPKVKKTRQVKTYPYKDQPLTVSELATLAGVSNAAMHSRLKTMTPEQAVSFITGSQITGRTYPYKDQQLTISKLAALAGITHAAMYGRLKTMSAEQAVSMPSRRKRTKAEISAANIAEPVAN